MTLASIILFLDSIGTGELLLIAFVALLIFGPEKIPTLMRSMGAATRTFKNAMNDVKHDLEQSMNETETPTVTKNLPKPGQGDHSVGDTTNTNVQNSTPQV